MPKIIGKGISFRPVKLIHASYTITRREDDIINLILSLFEHGKKSYTIPMGMFMEYYNVKAMHRNYTVLQEAADLLKDRTFSIENQECHWVSSISYEKDHFSEIKIEISDELYRILSVEKQQGVYYKISQANNISSEIGRRLFYSLSLTLGKSIEKWKKETVETIYTRSLLEKEYKRLKPLLKTAINEINKYSNFYVEFAEEKEKTFRGNEKVYSLIFHMIEKTNEEKERANL